MSGAAKVRADLEPRRAEMIALLQKLVEIESPSDDRPGLDRALRSAHRDTPCDRARAAARHAARSRERLRAA